MLAVSPFRSWRSPVQPLGGHAARMPHSRSRWDLGTSFFSCLGLNCCQVVPCASFRVKQRAENEAQQRRKVKTGSDKLSINISAEIRANIPPQSRSTHALPPRRAVALLFTVVVY